MTNKSNQAALPHGIMGRFFGRIMGWLNTDMEKSAIDQLQLQGDEKVLEIGFGSGVGLIHLVHIIPEENIAGLEPSTIMLKQAQSRLSVIRKQGVDLRNGSSASIPWEESTFDAIFTVNNIQLWNLPKDLIEVKRVLKPNGILSVAVHGWAMKERDKVSKMEVSLERLRKLFAEAGFLMLSSSAKKSRSGEAMYFLCRSLQ